MSGAAAAPSRTACSETAPCSMRSRCVLNSAGVSRALRDNRPSAIAIGERGVWVTNAGSGMLTPITIAKPG